MKGDAMDDVKPGLSIWVKLLLGLAGIACTISIFIAGVGVGELRRNEDTHAVINRDVTTVRERVSKLEAAREDVLRALSDIKASVQRVDDKLDRVRMP